MYTVMAPPILANTPYSFWCVTFPTTNEWNSGLHSTILISTYLIYFKYCLPCTIQSLHHVRRLCLRSGYPWKPLRGPHLAWPCKGSVWLTGNLRHVWSRQALRAEGLTRPKCKIVRITFLIRNINQL